MLWENGREYLPILFILALPLHLRSRYGFDVVGASEEVQEGGQKRAERGGIAFFTKPAIDRFEETIMLRLPTPQFIQ